MSFPKRYTDISFPEYKFRPGENPHPTEDPEGHSFGRHESAVWYPPERWQDNAIYLFGVDLYNYGYWWEAHEAWESLWKQPQASPTTKKFLQGLIKISAAFLKWHTRQQRGLEQLYDQGVSHLKDVLQEKEIYMGLDLAEHIAKVSRHFTPVVAAEDQWPDPMKDYPALSLKKDNID